MFPAGVRRISETIDLFFFESKPLRPHGLSPQFRASMTQDFDGVTSRWDVTRRDPKWSHDQPQLTLDIIVLTIMFTMVDQ